MLDRQLLALPSCFVRCFDERISICALRSAAHLLLRHTFLCGDARLAAAPTLIELLDTH
jgi:hypothetical protein